MKLPLRILYIFFGGTAACVALALIIKTFILSMKLSSECSEKATRAGMNQKVISFSLYRGNSSNETTFRARYVPGLRANYQRIQQVYPGWLMRVYTNIPEDSELIRSFSNETNLHICNVAKLPGVGNVTNVIKMAWRFLVLGDPTVSIAIIRDLDSLPSDREKAAVTEWEKSNKIFHAMRDHPFHKYKILGGMWGVKPNLLNSTVRNATIARFIQRKGERWGDDQLLLGNVLYRRYKHLFMIHDSYRCRYFKDSVPFPTQRNGSDFVGKCAIPIPKKVKPLKCPVKCRPSYGKNWTYC